MVNGRRNVHHQVVIVGGGTAGLTVAAQLMRERRLETDVGGVAGLQSGPSHVGQAAHGRVRWLCELSVADGPQRAHALRVQVRRRAEGDLCAVPSRRRGPGEAVPVVLPPQEGRLCECARHRASGPCWVVTDVCLSVCLYVHSPLCTGTAL